MRTARSVSTGDCTTPWNGLNCPGSRGYWSPGEYGLRNGYGQAGPVLRKTEAAGEICVSSATVSQLFHLPAL